MVNGKRINGKIHLELRKLVCERCSYQCYAFRERGEYNYYPNSKPHPDVRDKPFMLHRICKNYDVVGKIRRETIEQMI